MKKPADTGPVCPGCGYAIFGLREMRCPECGRILDVRDFSIDSAEHRGDSAKYERTAAAGGVMGIILILGLLAGLLTIVNYFMRFHVVPMIFPLAIGVAGQTGRSFWALFKDRRK